MFMCTEVSDAPESPGVERHCCPICNADWMLGNEYYGEGAAFACGARLTPAGHGSWTLSTPCPAALIVDDEDADELRAARKPDIFELAAF